MAVSVSLHLPCLCLSVSFFLSLFLSFPDIYSVYPTDPRSAIFFFFFPSFFYRRCESARRRGFTARGIRTTLVRLRALLPVTRRIPFFSSLSAALRGVSVAADIFLRVKVEERREERSRAREETRESRGRFGARWEKGEKGGGVYGGSYYFVVLHLPSYVKYTAYGKLASFARLLNS